MGIMELLGMGGGLAPGIMKDALDQKEGADIQSLLGSAAAVPGASPEGGFKGFLGGLGKKGPHSSESFLGRAGNVAHTLDNNSGFRGLTGQQPKHPDLSQIDPKILEALKQIYGGGNGAL